MKRSIVRSVISTLLGLSLVLGLTQQVAANPTLYTKYGPYVPPDFLGIDFTADPVSAKADGAQKIALSLYGYQYFCEDDALSWPEINQSCPSGATPVKKPVANKEFRISVVNYSGSSDSQTAGLQFNGTHTQPGQEAQFVTTDNDGKASFTVSSKVAGSRTLNASREAGDQFVTITFTDTKAPAATPKPGGSSDASTPSIANITINGQGQADLVFEEHESLVLAGTTVPHGSVKLYIFSSPKEATITANEEGIWTYTLPKLKPGRHHIDAQVTDPATNTTAPLKTIANFTVTQKTTAQKPKQDTNLWLWAISTAIVTGVVAWMLVRSNKRQQRQAPQSNVKTATIQTKKRDGSKKSKRPPTPRARA